MQLEKPCLPSAEFRVLRQGLLHPVKPGDRLLQAPAVTCRSRRQVGSASTKVTGYFARRRGAQRLLFCRPLITMRCRVACCSAALMNPNFTYHDPKFSHLQLLVPPCRRRPDFASLSVSGLLRSSLDRRVPPCCSPHERQFPSSRRSPRSRLDAYVPVYPLLVPSTSLNQPTRDCLTSARSGETATSSSGPSSHPWSRPWPLHHLYCPRPPTHYPLRASTSSL